MPPHFEDPLCRHADGGHHVVQPGSLRCDHLGGRDVLAEFVHGVERSCIPEDSLPELLRIARPILIPPIDGLLKSSHKKVTRPWGSHVLRGHEAREAAPISRGRENA